MSHEQDGNQVFMRGLLQRVWISLSCGISMFDVRTCAPNCDPEGFARISGGASCGHAAGNHRWL